MVTRAHGFPRVLSVMMVITLASSLVSVLAATESRAATTALPQLALRPVADVKGGTALAARTGDTALYVAQQQGVVVAVLNGHALDAPVLDISDEVSNKLEQGLLGLAFSPDGTHLYVDFTDRSGRVRVDELTMNGRVADLATRRTLLDLFHPQQNHNGGQLAFGPDGDLYIGIGDGGNGYDQGPGHAPGGNAQSLGTLLGKILRIIPTPAGGQPYSVPSDNPFVGDADARPEIWAFGLRNPWRFSFDSANGDLWIGDVGQDTEEEIDLARATRGRDAGKGANFGWNRMEGNDHINDPVPDNVVAPVITHTHDEGWLAIIGGYVYRGSLKGLRGVYLYSDYYEGAIRGARRAGDGATDLELGLPASHGSAFGEGLDHSIYVLSQTDGLSKLVRAKSGG